MIISSRSDGFVLVAVIWVLAALGLVVSFLGVQLEQMQNQSIAMESRRIEAFDRLSVESIVLYLASTRTASYRGLHTDIYTVPSPKSTAFQLSDGSIQRGDEIELDGSQYKVRGGLLLSVQDAGSLISLRADQPDRLQKLLQAYGLSSSDIQRLQATLADYIDRDDSESLNGAERRDYERLSLVPPTNRFLVSPGQVRNILEWSRLIDEMPGFFEEVTIYVADQENYNTMTRKALEIFYFQDSDVDRVLNYRMGTAFTQLSEVLEVTGALFDRDSLAVTFFPSQYMILKIEDPDGIVGERIGVTLTPNSNLAPWQVDYRVAINSLEHEHDSTASVEPKTPPTTLIR